MKVIMLGPCICPCVVLYIIYFQMTAGAVKMCVMSNFIFTDNSFDSCFCASSLAPSNHSPTSEFKFASSAGNPANKKAIVILFSSERLFR
uniref:Putative secreted protein n=1 Tax=Ixodes ricinus TaxID=34613 RepID=A0A6B0U0L5_IXORI